MKYLKQFNQRLRNMRENRRLSQKDVATFCLVDPSVVETWESDQSNTRCYPSLANILDLCFKTGAALEYFVDMPDAPIERQLGLPGISLGEDNDLADSLVELGVQIEKLIPTGDEQELLRRYRKSDDQTKELILQLIAN
ncbi:MAG: transcriptional regulator with XRE-family HTH domain [Oleiphilaceae bacterium]|jgi:transcriptional regulator with XRE-family HTH domain